MVYFLQLAQYVFIVTYNKAVFFLKINFITFDFAILSDLSSYRNNLVEILFIRAFLVYCLIYLNISLIVLKISKSSLSESIVINIQPSFSSIAFCLYVSLSILLSW